MSTLVFDLSGYYKKTFGTSPPIVIPIIPNRLAEKIPSLKKSTNLDLKEKKRFEYETPKRIFDKKEEDSNKYSKLGTPFYEKVEGDTLGREFFLPVTLNGIKLPYSTIRVSCKKTIVETPLVNRKGAVIEQINIENYKFKLRGFVIGDNNEFPDDDVTDLKDLFEVNESIVMRNALSDIFLTSDDKVIITAMEIPEVKGVKNVRPFEFDIISDSEFTLIVE